MQQQNRTKQLAIALFSIVGVMGAVKGLNNFVLDPIDTKNGEISALNLKIEEKQSEELQLARDTRTVRDWTSRSLPPKDVDAQRLYKDWVTALADMTGFEDLVIEPGPRKRMPISGRSRSRKTLYNSVQVTLKGKTTFDRLSRFLYYFDRSEIPQRIVDLKIVSDENEGNPLLKVTLTVEALSFAAAKPRSRIFPETELKKPLESDVPRFDVASTDGFPKAKEKKEFPVRIGRQLMTVTNRDGQSWTVRPGIDPAPESDVASLSGEAIGTRIEQFPVRLNPARTLADYRREVFGIGKSPFVLPVPPRQYSPRLRGLSNQIVNRGQSVRLQVEAVDVNPDRGEAVYSLEADAPKGMSIDARTGVIRWEPAATDPAQRYTASIIVKQGSGEKPLLTGSVRIDLIDPNKPPTLDVATDHTGLLGTEITFTAKGQDPDGQPDRLRYSLAGAPDGATIDSRTGTFAWTPSEDVEPREFTFDVVVTDAGSPAGSAKKSVTVALRENTEKFIKLVAIIATDGERQAWLYDISTKKQHIVSEGSSFTAAGVTGFVYVIGQEFLEFQSGTRSYRLPLGRFLSERKAITAPQTKTAGAPKPTDTTNAAVSAKRAGK